MKSYLTFTAAVALAACGGPLPDIPTNGPTPTPTPVVHSTPGPNNPDNPDGPNQPEGNMPCRLVERETFTSETDQTLWQPSYYYTPKSSTTIKFTDDGVVFQSQRTYREGITATFNRDITICPSMWMEITGKVDQASLGSTGWDDREAPLAVMVQYTDLNGVKHSSLNAFNEGEPDDRGKTRMFWHGFNYLIDYTQRGFTPTMTTVNRGEEFTAMVDFTGVAKVIHTVTIEASGWGPISSTLKSFAMKPYEAFMMEWHQGAHP